jgi:hypothetical protein
MGVLQLLAADETTVLWDFHDTTGAANPGTVVTKLSGSLDLGTIETNLSIFRTAEPGGQKLGVADPPVEFTVMLLASASSYDNLVTGLGQLARWLRDPPGPLKWTQGGAARYLDLLGTPTLPALLRGQGAAGLVALRKSSLGPIPLTMLRQPWMREATVTPASDTVANDPVTDSRVFAVTASGDLPTPAKVRVQMDSGSAVERVLIGHRAQGAEAAAVMADYLSDTAFAQLDASGRGWTVSLGTGTASSADTDASGGNAARITTSLTDLLRRSRLTRTTKIDSIRGAWDVWWRGKAWGAAKWSVQLRWGPSLADSPEKSEPPVPFDTSVNGTPPAFGYTELKLGRIYIPEDVALGGITLEWWAQRISGSGDLSGDHIWLVPADDNSTVVVPGGSAATVLGKDLTTPPYKITSDPTWVAGAVTSNVMRLNAVNEGAGSGPNTGTDLSDGLNRSTFKVTGNNLTATIKLRVVNVTDNTETVALTATLTNYSNTLTRVLAANAVAAKFYQAEVVITSYTSGSLDVVTIQNEFVPSLASGESLRTEPGTRYAVDRLDSSGNLAGFLGIEGEIPVMVEPGANHIMLRADEIPLALYEENENKKGRTMTITVSYAPRYAL